MRSLPKLKIGLIRLTVERGNIQENLEKSVNLIGRTQGEIICLPELFVTGREFLPQLMKGNIISTLKKEAKRIKSYIIAGSFFEEGNGKIFNTSTIIDNRGRIIGKYRKTHQIEEERRRISGGDCLPVFDTEWGKIGIMICYDMYYPEMARVLSLKGAKVTF